MNERRKKDADLVSLRTTLAKVRQAFATVDTATVAAADTADKEARLLDREGDLLDTALLEAQSSMVASGLSAYERQLWEDEAATLRLHAAQLRAAAAMVRAVPTSEQLRSALREHSRIAAGGLTQLRSSVQEERRNMQAERQALLTKLAQVKAARMV